ncbi:MAG: group III truncated hemoglobin [Pseudomonadota bacterium]|nr:group III truncated hemoglobin [Pseudomonadota bacterium]
MQAHPRSPRSRMFDRPALTELVHRFYDAIRADAELGPVFEAELHDRWDAHLERMVDFWCTATKVSRSFRGDVYGKHMALPRIAPPHLKRWLRLWKAYTQVVFPAAEAVVLQDIATGVARVMHLGWFGRLPAQGALENWMETEGADACTA